MTVVPLVVALVITGVAATSDLRHVGRLGARAIPVFVALLLAGGGFALLLAPLSLDRLAIAPDVAAALRAHAAADTAAEEASRMPGLVERIVAIVPPNPLRAAADGAILPLIVFTVIFAVALARLEPARREPVVRVFQTIADVMLVVVGWVLAVAPVGIFALALALAARMGASAAGALLHYVATLSAVLLLFTLALYPVARALGGVPLRRFTAALAPAQAVAFSSRSSLATLPALIAGARDRLAAPPAITGFVLPLAVSVFRVNVPIAWVVGALFLGRLYGVSLDLPAVVGLVVTATLISFSVPGIPSASLFLLAPVLVDLGLPAAGAGILIAVDAIPDMFKTTLNVTSHLATAAILGRGNRAEQGERGGASMSQGAGRVEAFSDGVFAIAITLLILEIRVPHATADHGLWAGLVALWPSYLALVFSFFVILVMWVNHHELMRLVRAVGYPFLFANGFVLLTVTFVPFPTAVLAEHLATPEAKAAVTFYCGTFVVNSVAWYLLFFTIVRGRLLRPDIDAETIARIRRAYQAGPLVYVVATVVAQLQPVLGLVLNASLWLLWIRLCYHTTREARRRAST